MENNTVLKLIVGFVGLIIGLALIGSIANSSNAVTERTTASSEALDLALDRDLVTGCVMGINGTNEYVLTNAPTGWKSADCPITNFLLLNQTGLATTANTDYTLFASNGSVFLANTTAFVLPNCSATGTGAETANATTMHYDYCPDAYLNSSWGRTILDLVPGFFALAILLGSVALFYSVAKDTGIVGK